MKEPSEPTAHLGMPPRGEVICYTDGACSGNPGPGGYGAVLHYGPHSRELSAGFRRTTNQRMELRACIAALTALTRRCRVTVVTDSLYVVKGVNEWAPAWKKRGWRRPGGKPVENLDLWQELDALCLRHAAAFEWVKGHNGHPGNERADELARLAIRDGAGVADAGYEETRD